MTFNVSGFRLGAFDLDLNHVDPDVLGSGWERDKLKKGAYLLILGRSKPEAAPVRYTGKLKEKKVLTWLKKEATRTIGPSYVPTNTCEKKRKTRARVCVCVCVCVCGGG